MIQQAHLPTLWRQRADVLRENGAAGHAKAIQRCADELEVRDATYDEEPFTLAQAAQWSGFSEKHLRRLVDQGELDDVGTDGLRLRRCDLPRHAKSRRTPSLAARRVLGHHVVES